MKEVYYFSHDSNARNDEKIINLRMNYDWFGVGVFWALIEMLKDSSTLRLKANYKAIAFDLRVKEEDIEKIINDYDLFIVEDDYFYSQSLCNRMSKRVDKSKVGADNAKKRWEKGIKEPKQTKEVKPPREKKEIIIPTLREFMQYAKEKDKDYELKKDKINLKYNSWVENGWCNGYNKPIVNWKTTLLNSLVYIPKDFKKTENRL